MPAALPGISLAALTAEAVRAARSAKVPSMLVVILVALAGVTTVMTVGRADAAEAQVASRMDEAGSRELRVTDVQDAGLLPPIIVAQLASTSTVERTVGLGPVLDVVNAAVGAGSSRVPVWTISHGLFDAVELTSGRWLAPGEALVTEAAAASLGFQDLVGTLSTVPIGGHQPRSFAVVGTYAPRPPLTDVDGAVLSEPDRATRTLVVVVADAAASAPTEAALLAMIAAPDPGALRVESPTTLAQVRGEVLGDLAVFGRGLVVLVLGSGALLVAVVVFADTLTRRVDLGRRRALGAPRWELVFLVVGRTGAAAVLGAVLGVVVSVAVAHLTGLALRWSFVLGTSALTVLAALVAAVPPTVLAAYQDPVRVLRTP